MAKRRFLPCASGQNAEWLARIASADMLVGGSSVSFRYIRYKGWINPQSSLTRAALAKGQGRPPYGVAFSVYRRKDCQLTITEVWIKLTAWASEVVGVFSLPGAFVGRQQEMAELSRALEDAIAGRGRVVMLAGEPGIGKTRTAEELASIAEQRGVLTLWGRCYEEQGAPPYWPWVQPIRAYLQAASAERLLSEAGAGAADIAEIVPDMQGIVGATSLQPPPDLPPEQARFRLFDSVTTFLKNASQNQPLLLVLDDLHWADRPSLLMLEFAAQEVEDSRLVVLGTYRDVEVSRGHPLSQTLAQLARQRSFQRIHLGSLERESIDRLMVNLSGAAPSDEITQAIYEHTEGNPFFITEIARYLAHENELTPDRLRKRTWDLGIPEGVRDVIGRRLDHLSEGCNQALTLASVIGREFDLRQLAALMENVSEDALLELLEEALDAHIIREAAGSLEGYQFTHALIQETLLDELSAARRVRLHARIASALEELYGPAADEHAAALARHFAEAETVLGGEKLVRYSIMAGEQALAVYAYEDALDHFQRALDAREGQAPSTRSEPAEGTESGQGMDAEAAAILAGLGHALVALGQHEQAAANLQHAFAYYAEVRDVARAVAAVEYPHNLWLNRLMKDTLAQALDLVPAGSLQSARLLCSYGLSVGARGNGYAQGQEALEESLAIARFEGDVALERRVMAASAQVDGAHVKWEQSLKKSLRALELATRVDDDPIGKLRAHIWACNSSYAIGNPRRAEGHNTEMHAIAESLRDVYWLEQSIWQRRVLAYLSGQWEALHTLDDRAASAESNSVLAMSMCQTGDFDKGKAYMSAMTGDGYGDRARSLWPLVAACFCCISSEAGLLTEVEAAARDALANPELPPIWALDAHAALAQAAALRHEASAAAEQYAVLKSCANTVTQTGMICIDRVLGLLSRTMGNLDTAQAHFEDALAFCRKAGYRPELAWTCYDYANMLVGEGGFDKLTRALKPSSTDAYQKALALLEEALAISAALGMKPLMEKAAALKERVESQPSKAPAYPDGLTEREVEVLRLIAAGKINREIGEALFISLNTVARHVSNIFAKTEASNRAEAAAYATRHNLTDASRKS
jgi:DNA-binding CsgD family transcriptional regulator